MSTAKPKLYPRRTPSSRQLEILALVAKGCTNRDIASQLGIKERTVEDHLIKSYRILGVANRTGAAFRLLELGWLQSKPQPEQEQAEDETVS